MSLYLHTIKPQKSKRQKTKRIGRGGKRGTYSGRGIKGQRARSGGKSGLKRKGLRQLMERTHKLRGFKSIQSKPAVINLDKLNANFKDGEVVSPQSLVRKKLVSTAKNGVKILSKGKINTKINVSDCQLSAKARQAIEKAGGKIS